MLLETTNAKIMNIIEYDYVICFLWYFNLLFFCGILICFFVMF